MSANYSVSLDFMRREKLEIFDQYVLALIQGKANEINGRGLEDIDQCAKMVVYFAARLAAHREEVERRIIEREMQKPHEEYE